MRIVLLDAYTLNHGDLTWLPLTALGHVEIYEYTSLADVEERAADAEVVVVNKFLINEASLKLMPSLKYVIVTATGYNNVDSLAVKNRGVIVSNVRGYSTQSVAQHVFSCLLNHYNKTEHYQNRVEDGAWVECRDFSFYDHSIGDLCGKTIGILGYGDIGKKVVQIALAFDMNVLVHTRSNLNFPNGSANIRQVDKNTLLNESDILTLHAPLNEGTSNFVNRETLSQMKSDAVLINTARGGLVNEQDLSLHLKENKAFDAFLDVLSVEPPSASNPLLGINNCKVTPHIAWASKGARTTLLQATADSIIAYQSGKPINLVL